MFRFDLAGPVVELLDNELIQRQSFKFIAEGLLFFGVGLDLGIGKIDELQDGVRPFAFKLFFDLEESGCFSLFDRNRR